jgi:hypothetical protein
MTSCHQAEEEPQTQETLDLPPFEDSVLSYDHYNGVTLNLGKYLNCQGWQNEHETTNGDVAVETSSADNPPSNSFARQLDKALQFWRAEGRKGIWIHAPPIASSLIPDCVSAGFDFHKVLRENVTDEEESKPPTLVLSRWLPDTPSKLPLGPSHQVGVGVVVLNPADPSQMLCVQEQSGPGAYDIKCFNEMLPVDSSRPHHAIPTLFSTIPTTPPSSRFLQVVENANRTTGPMRRHSGSRRTRIGGRNRPERNAPGYHLLSTSASAGIQQ